MTGEIRWLALALLIGGTSPVLAFESTTTKHDFEQCPLIKEEDDLQQRRCQGFGSVAVNYYNSADDALVDFGDKGSADDWPGQSFVFAGDTIEWRSETKAGAPFAAIVRYDIGRSIGGPFRSRLVIYHLDGNDRSCVAATVDGSRAGAAAAARKLADSFARNFKCGQDRRRVL